MARTVAWRGLKVPCSRLRPKKTTEVSFFDCLEDELLVEILQRIPSLSLIHRCKCVSKHWSTIISSDYFIRCYIKFSKFKSLISSDGEGKNWSDSNLRFALFYQRNHYRGETGLTREQGQFRLGFTLSSMILRSSPPPPGMSLDFLPAHPCPTEPYHVLATDGGLVLCCETLFLQRQYYVCNPLTKQHLKIPPPPINRKWVRIGFLCKTTTTGSSSCSFRIVRVPNFEEEYTSLLRAEIYTSETGDWTELVLDRSGNLGLLWKYLHCGFLSSAIACGGLLHWKGDGYVFVYDPYNNKDEYTTLELPERRKDDVSRDSKLGECKGKLRHSVFYSNSFDVWELKDCFEWFLVQRVRFDQFTSSSPQITSFLKSIGTVYKFVFCLCFHPFDGDVLFTWLKGQIVICCMKTKTMTCVGLPPTELTGCAPLAFPFVLPWWPVPLTPPPPPPVQALP